MKDNNNRSRIIGLRLTLKEYVQIETKWKRSTCRKLSEFVRNLIFDKPITTTFRNQSLDDLMTEVVQLRRELNNIGNNFNQGVKKLHTLNHLHEFRSWIMMYESDRRALVAKVEQIKVHIQKLAETWLR